MNAKWFGNLLIIMNLPRQCPITDSPRPLADQEFSCLLLSVNGCGFWWKMLKDIKERILDSNPTKA